MPRPSKPTQPSEYKGLKDTDVKTWGSNGGWGESTLTELDVVEAKFGKSYGVLGTGGRFG